VSQPVDEELAGEAIAVAAPGREWNGAMAEKGEPRVDPLVQYQFGALQLGEQCRHMAARQFILPVAEYLFARPAAVLNDAMIVEGEHGQIILARGTRLRMRLASRTLDT
jgi:hypothetical protein